MKKFFPITLVALATMFAALGPATAQIIAINENAAPDSSPAATGLAALEFTLTKNIDIDYLGFYASSINGADQPHVSLFDLGTGPSPSIPADPTPNLIYDTGNMVTQGAITTNNDWNYIATPTLSLQTGHTYLLSAPIYFSEQFNSTSGFTYGSASIGTTSFLVDKGWNGWANSSYDFSTLAPTTTPTGGAYLSANFAYLETVPEPSTYLLFGASALLLLAMQRRRSQNSSF